MNFNIGSPGHTNEYNLFKNMTEEGINLYGIPVKYIKAEKVNKDFVFGEWSHIKVDYENIYEIYMLPVESETWSSQGDLFSKFGLQNLDTIQVIISVKTMEEIHPNIVTRTGKGFDFIIGNLVVLPSNKIMEITNIETEVQGLNNIFTYDLNKNAYQLTLRQYIANNDDYSKASDITESDEYDYEDFGNLASIFGSNDESKEEIESRSTEIQDEVIYPNEPRIKPIRRKDKENSPFGYLG
jgi:hypothetical protein